MTDAKTVRELLHYDQETGIFTWKMRQDRRQQWNGRFAGRVAGTAGVKRRYININIGNRLYRAHRLAWLYVNGEWPVGDIDHINCNPADNRISNLRVATRSQNAANTRRHQDSKTEFKGIKRNGRGWLARIKVSGKQLHLGTFDAPERAHRAYMAAARQHFGEFARAA
jgi:hypothetical protein